MDEYLDKKGNAMSDFINRISAQRDILLLVNSTNWHEELLGLSTGAIGRWIQSNQLEVTSHLVLLIKMAADKLFFLANKSQEQITEDYRSLSLEVTNIIEQIETAMRKQFEI